MRRITLLTLLLTLALSSQSRRVQIFERWNDSNWSRVVVKLRSGEEISYDRSQLWGLFYDYGSSHASAAPAAPSSPPPLAVPSIPSTSLPASSRWAITANGIPGELTLNRTPSGWSGRINLDGAWEDLSQISVTSTSISFHRHVVSQRYSGQLRGASVSGSFTDSAGGSYSWSAQRR